MMLTRCPHCQATFRITPEQLKARQGRVRCGQCRQVFNAISGLLDNVPPIIAPPAPAPEPTPVPTPTPVPSPEPAVQSFVVPPPPEPGTRPEPVVVTAPEPEPDPLPEPEWTIIDPANEEAPAAATAREPQLEPASEAEFAFESIPTADKVEPGWPAEPGDESPDGFEAVASTEPPQEPEQEQPQAPEAPEPEPAEPEPAPTAFPDVDVSHIDEVVVATPTPDADDEMSDPETLIILDDAPPAIEEEKAAPVVPRLSAFFPHLGRRAEAEERIEPEVHSERAFDLSEELPPQRKRRWPWAMGSVLALLVMVAQLAIHYRTELATSMPSTRPMLVVACDVLGCTVELPRKIELIGLESSDLSPDENRPGRLHLAAALRNRAAFAQTWPHLEITLTDAAEHALLRRVVAPSEYLPEDASPEEGFLKRSEKNIQLVLDVSDVPAVGYRLYVFYP